MVKFADHDETNLSGHRSKQWFTMKKDGSQEWSKLVTVNNVCYWLAMGQWWWTMSSVMLACRDEEQYCENDDFEFEDNWSPAHLSVHAWWSQIRLCTGEQLPVQITQLKSWRNISWVFISAFVKDQYEYLTVRFATVCGKPYLILLSFQSVPAGVRLTSRSRSISRWFDFDQLSGHQHMIDAASALQEDVSWHFFSCRPHHPRPHRVLTSMLFASLTQNSRCCSNCSKSTASRITRQLCIERSLPGQNALCTSTKATSVLVEIAARCGGEIPFKICEAKWLRTNYKKVTGMIIND